MGSTKLRRTETQIKSFYFLYFSAAAALLPYLALIYEGRGIAGRRIGILAALPPLITLFAASLWSGFADATQSHRRLLAVSIGGTILSAVGIYFGSTFLFIATMVVMFAFFNSPIIPLIDNTTMKFLKEEDHRYGRLRLWGAVGWGITAPLVGLLVNRYGLAWPFYGFVFILFLCLLSIVRLPVSRADIGQNYWVGFSRLMRDRRWVLFLLVIFATGIGTGIIHNYLFLYMNRMNAEPVLMGLSLTVSTVSELLIFAYSDRMLVRWGIRNMLIFTIITLIIRMFAYSLVTVAWTVLFIQLLHGFTFSIPWVAGVAFANRMAPRGLETTAQGIFSGLFMGLAAAVGAFAGGWMYEAVGPFLMFRWSAMGIMVLAALIGLVWWGISAVNRGGK